MTETYDAIIIGAGHNGLVAAAYLAKARLKVLVVESRNMLGGAASTEQIFPGYYVNTGASDAGLFRPKIIRDLELEKYGLRFIQSDAAVFAPLRGDMGLTLWRDVRRSAEEIGRFSKRDAARYPEFLSYMNSLATVLKEILEQTPPDMSDLTLSELLPWLKVGLNLRRSGQQKMMEFFRVLPLPIRDFLDEWFESDELKGVLALPAISGGMPGPFAAGTTLMFIYQQLGEPNAGYRSSSFIVGGQGTLAETLRAVAEAYGATIRRGTGVSKVWLDDERVQGVVLENGESIPSQFVVSSIDPRRTFFDLVGGAHLMPQFMRSIKNIRFRGTTAKVHLALSGLPDFSGVDHESQLKGFIAISPDMEYLERAWDDAKYGRISSEPILEATIPTLLDPQLAPTDCHIMSITAQYAPYDLKIGHWDARREELGDLVIDTFARFVPNLPELILHRQVITPLDWEREYGLTEGCIYQGKMEMDQLFFMRPTPGFARYRTPFHNLYLCGAGTHPGGGVTGAPGFNAANEILLDWRKAS